MTEWVPKIVNNNDVSLDKTIFDAISLGDIPALVLRNFYSKEDCEKLASQTSNFSKHMHGETYLKKIGVFLSAYQNEKEDYFSHAKLANDVLNKTFTEKNPVHDIHNKIKEISNFEISTATEDGATYSQGIIRLWETGDFGPLHRDNANFEVPNYQISKYENQLSCVLYLQEPELGGELVIYRQKWEKSDEKFREIGFGYTKKVLKTSEKATVFPSQGDLVIFNPNHYHEILPISGIDRRITFGNFFGYNNSSNVAESWS